ncbi:unnamed protein product [Lota lota]
MIPAAGPRTYAPSVHKHSDRNTGGLSEKGAGLGGTELSVPAHCYFPFTSSPVPLFPEGQEPPRRGAPQERSPPGEESAAPPPRRRGQSSQRDVNPLGVLNGRSSVGMFPYNVLRTVFLRRN